MALVESAEDVWPEARVVPPETVDHVPLVSE
jgi:hypothetical protein